jgi:hypothetical protein
MSRKKMRDMGVHKAPAFPSHTAQPAPAKGAQVIVFLKLRVEDRPVAMRRCLLSKARVVKSSRP